MGPKLPVYAVSRLIISMIISYNVQEYEMRTLSEVVTLEMKVSNDYLIGGISCSSCHVEMSANNATRKLKL